LEHLPGPLPPREFFTSLTAELCGNSDEFSICHWDDFSDKSKCFDYDDLVTTREFEDNLGIDVGILPNRMENIVMRDHCDSNGIWAETTRNLRSQIFDCELQLRGHGFKVGSLTNISRFLKETRTLLRRERRSVAQPFETVQVKI
jgi:hypothetical protein